MQEGYLSPSFATITAYAENGAVIHYHATGVSRRMLTYADVCCRMLMYADVCCRLLTYADFTTEATNKLLGYDSLSLRRMLTYADVC